MDTIIIADLEVHFRVGVPEAERAAPQRLAITLELEGDFSAAAGDDLRRTVDYHAVVQRIRAWGEGREWRLIETLAVELAEQVRSEFGPRAVTVEVKKFILPETRYVAVRVRRPAPA